VLYLVWDVLRISTLSPGLYEGEVVLFYVSLQSHQGCTKVKWYVLHIDYSYNLIRAVWKWSGMFYVFLQSHQGCMKVKWYVLRILKISLGLYEGEVVCFTYPYNLTRAVWRSSGMFYVYLQSHQGCMKVKWSCFVYPYNLTSGAFLLRRKASRYVAST